MAVFDENILSSLFDPNYIDINFCAKLESISMLFRKCSQKFYTRLRCLDLKKEFQRCGYESFEASDKAYAQFLEKIAKRCPNVQRILNLSVDRDDLEAEQANLRNLAKLSNVSYIDFDFLIDHPSIIAILAGMPNLQGVNIVKLPYKFSDEEDSAENAAKNENRNLLNLEFLSLNSPTFFTHCNLEKLQVVHFGLNLGSMSSPDRPIDELRILAQCPDLRELEIAHYVQQYDVEEFLRLIDFLADALKKLEKFHLAVSCDFVNLKILTKNANFRKYARKLDLLFSSGENHREVFYEVCKLQNLQCLEWPIKNEEPAVIFSALPKLDKVFVNLLSETEFGRRYYRCDIRTTYKKCLHGTISFNSTSDLLVQLTMEEGMETTDSVDRETNLISDIKGNCPNVDFLLFSANTTYEDVDRIDNLSTLRAIAEHCPNIRKLELSRPFYKETALLASVCFK